MAPRNRAIITTKRMMLPAKLFSFWGVFTCWSILLDIHSSSAPRGSNCGSRRSVRRRTLFAFDDCNTGAGANTCCTCSNHSLCVLEGTHTAGGLDAQVRAHGTPQQGDVLHCGAAAVEARRGLDEVGPGLHGSLARQDLLVVAEQGSLDDDLQDGLPGVHGFGNSLDVVHQGALVRCPGSGDVDDHVHFIGTVQHRPARLEGLHVAGCGAQRETRHGARQHAGALEGGLDRLDPHRVHAHRLEPVLGGLGAHPEDFGLAGLRLQQRVVDERSDARSAGAPAGGSCGAGRGARGGACFVAHDGPFQAVAQGAASFRTILPQQERYAAAASCPTESAAMSSAAQAPAADPDATSRPSRTPSNAAASPMAQMPGTEERKSLPTTIPPDTAVFTPAAAARLSRGVRSSARTTRSPFIRLPSSNTTPAAGSTDPARVGTTAAGLAVVRTGRTPRARSTASAWPAAGPVPTRMPSGRRPRTRVTSLTARPIVSASS